MAQLNTAPNFGVPGQAYRQPYTPGDDFYEMLLDGHAGLSDEQSALMNARLVLLLANHVGDLRVLAEAIAAARAGVAPADAAAAAPFAAPSAAPSSVPPPPPSR